MNVDHYLSELATRSGIKKIFVLLLVCSIATSFLLAIYIISKKDKVQTILVPPELQRTVTISNQQISREYLEEMGVFMSQLLLNASPASIEGQHQMLLKYVDPRYYQALSNELTVSRQFVKRQNVSTWFVPRRVTGYTTNNTVEIEGQFMISQGDTIAQKFNRKLLVTFRNVDGKVALVSIKEEVKKRGGRPKNIQSAQASEPVPQNSTVQNQVDALEEDATEVVDFVAR